MRKGFWDGKRRYVALLMLIAGIFVALRVPPVVPVIQLPGEKYPPGTIELPFGLGVMTNTLMMSIIVWILLVILALYVRSRRPKSGAEVPRGGFYNLFEMVFEGLYGFVSGLAPERYFRPIFGMFMTIFLIVLLSNWAELLPGIDSVGFIEAHYETVVDEETGEVQHVPTDGWEIYPAFFGGWALNGQCDWVSPEAEAQADADALVAAEQAAEEARAEAELELKQTGGHGEEAAAEGDHSEEGGHGEEATASTIDPDARAEEAFREVEAAYVAQKQARRDRGCYTGVAQIAWSDLDAKNFSDTTVEDDHAATEDEHAADAEHGETTDEHAAADEAHGDEHGGEHAEFHVDPNDPEQRKAWPFVVLPYIRSPSTDLNMTLALALCAMAMVQVIGFQALGLGYLRKFFAFENLFKSPLGAIDVFVGLLELIGEFAKVLSFAFRLLGNIFAGSILLFVMSFLVTVLPWPFFMLEFFVGIIQALVFALLTAIFMSLATVSHHHDDEHGEHAEEGAH
ncbi:MAG: hypothetical protein D6712_04195 [Chloroflexi bacterium]|nr:MAG: hypothetical protein D6712_04195 [Chloroflexota bacterium]